MKRRSSGLLGCVCLFTCLLFAPANAALPADHLFNNKLSAFPACLDHVYALSGGYEGGNLVVIKAGGHLFQDNRKAGSNEAGLYLLAISNNEVVLNEQFNTLADKWAGGWLKESIHALPKGAFVIAAVKDEATKRFTQEAQEALRMIGARKGLLGQPFRTSYLCIGMKGLRPGKAVEKAGMSPQRFAGEKSTHLLEMKLPAYPPIIEIPQGESKVSFEMAGLNKGRPVVLWIYRPQRFTSASDILFVMHGKNRNGGTYLKRSKTLGDQHGALIVAAEFPHPQFAGGAGYNRGGMEIYSENYWAYSVVDHLFQYLKSCTKSEKTTYKIIGHSAGGQFVHRFVMFKPDARYSLAIAQNAGAYCMPDFKEPFPYGLKGQGHLTFDSFKKVLRRKLIIMLGEKDTSELGGSAARRRQGKHRLERGMNFLKTAARYAAKLNLPLRWKVHTVPHVGHDSSRMIPEAAHLLFPSLEPR